MRIFSISWRNIGTTGDAILGKLSRLLAYWPLSWRSLSALILGVLLAKWFWIIFAPHVTYTAALPESTSSLEAGQLFGMAASNEAAGEGVALPNVKLLGIFSANSGKPGFAILKLDNNRQAGIAEGEEVAPGTRLVAVEENYVLLERAGIRQRVNLEDKYANAANKAGFVPAYGTAAANLQNGPPGSSIQDRPRRQHK
jgi:hypothetical protein